MLRRGRPLKGVSREKTPLHEKNPFFFFLDTMFPHSKVLFCHPSRTRYFIFIGSRFNLCWSASVTHQVQGDCVLSKTSVLQAQCIKHGPWSIRTPENLRCHTVFNWFITDLMVVSQPLVVSRHRRIWILTTFSGCWRVQQLPIKSCGFVPTPMPVHYRTPNVKRNY